MESIAKKKSRRMKIKMQIVCLSLLLVLLVAAIISIAGQFMGLNRSVEYERSVFISQIAEQMKNNVMTSRADHMELAHNFAAIMEEVQPRSFEELLRLFPDYAENKAVNRLFFLSSECEIYGIDGVKQWVSLPYEEYLLDAISRENTSDFIRIGMEQEYMVYSNLLSKPVMVDGQKIDAIMYAWDSSEYRRTLSSRLFEEKSSSLLVKKKGNIAIYPEGEGNESYGYNIFTYLTEQGVGKTDLKKIQELVAGTEDTTILCETSEGRWLFSVAYYDEMYRILIMLPIQNTSAGTYQSLYGLLASVVVSFFIVVLIVGMILASVVIRRREQRERELETELLMKTAQAKNDFLAKMSHDIRTPLNGIIGMNYIASTKIAPESTEAAECLRKVDTSAQYLLGILNDILDMSKIESGKQELSMAVFSMERLKNEIEPIVLSQIEGKNIRFLVDFPNDMDSDYFGDELRIKQILMNLLSNAVKFTEKGSISLLIKRGRVKGEKEEVTFIVRDTGKGMTEEFIEHIFSPFTQEDNGIAAKYGGSGLGLSIAKSFVDLMEGTISVTSKVNHGSEFIVTLPLEKRMIQPVKEQKMEEKYQFAGRRVLLCEDNELNAEIVTVILSDYGIEVDHAENGRIGVELFRQSAPGEYAMIFMDVRMPEMDGYEATRTIRAMERQDAREIPVCVLSANAFLDDIEASIASGMNEHLAKPLNLEQLDSVLKKYLIRGEA